MNWIWQELIDAVTGFLKDIFELLAEDIVNTMVENEVISAMLDYFVGLTVTTTAVTFVFLIIKGITEGSSLSAIKDVGIRFVIANILSVALIQIVVNSLKIALAFTFAIFDASSQGEIEIGIESAIKSLQTSTFAPLLVLVIFIFMTIYMMKFMIDLVKYTVKSFVIMMTYPFQAVEFLVGGTPELIEYMMQFVRVFLTMMMLSLFMGLGIGFLLNGALDVSISSLLIGFGMCTAGKEINDSLGRLGMMNSPGGGAGKMLMGASYGVNIVSTVSRMVS